MEHKAPYAIVGLFVCVCISALVWFTIWTQGNNDKDYLRYTILFPESVAGLQEGAQVSYRGIQVGKVEKLRLPPVDDSNVRVDISIRNDVPVRESSRAELARASLAGIVNLNIVAPKKGDQNPPKYLDGEPNPIIIGQPSALENALKDVPAITSQLRSVTGKLNQGIDSFQGSFVGKIMGQQKKPAQDGKQVEGKPVRTNSVRTNR